MQSRIEALKKAAASRKGHKDAGHGELRTIVEDEFLKEVTSTECVDARHRTLLRQRTRQAPSAGPYLRPRRLYASLCVCACRWRRFVLVHFFHPEFETCKVMDKHLRICAARPEALGTKFLRLEGACRAAPNPWPSP